MTNLERLKLELSNKEYYTIEEYSTFLQENNLEPTAEYNKADNQINLLKTVVSILETLANDVDLMRKIDSKDILTIDQAYKYLANRIGIINNKIIDLEEKANNYINIRPLFFNRRC